MPFDSNLNSILQFLAPMVADQDLITLTSINPFSASLHLPKYVRILSCLTNLTLSPIHDT
ncbi:hypothetical protein B0H19DRAFT_1137121 [Mycena capillaripes]|nr:hypothetical protein B0H19DRAFT_1137121 [Mycena capillaripes]